MNAYRLRKSFQIVSIFSLLSIDAAFASEGPPPILNPQQISSPSGKFTVHLKPTDLHGRGPGHVTMTEDGKTRYAIKKPYTFWDAKVTDEGVVAGYAYTHGWRGFAKEGGFRAGMGDFHVVILNANGGEVCNHVIKRTHSRFLHTPPNPLAKGVLLDPSNNRFIVRVANEDVNRRGERWWIYSLSSGELLREIDPAAYIPKQGNLQFVVAAQRVNETPLSLVHWWQSTGVGNADDASARFTLIDDNADIVWSLEKPRDYNIAGDEDAELALMYRIWREGALLPNKNPLEFDLHFVRERQRVTFRIQRTVSDNWQVKEIARRAYDGSQEVTDSIKPKGLMRRARVLTRLAPITLKVDSDPAQQPIRSVNQFEFDDDGRICFIRSDSEGLFLVRLTKDGRIDFEVEVPKSLPAPEHRFFHFAHIRGGQYLLTASAFEEDGKSKAWVVDCDGQTFTPLQDFDCPMVKALDTFSDGSFAVLGRGSFYYAPSKTVYAFDATGNRLWAATSGYKPGDPACLFSPDDMAITADDKVVVVDNIAGSVQVFDRHGAYLRTIDLKKSWGRKPNYPTSISAGANGGVIVEDFGAAQPMVVMDKDGHATHQLSPKFDDGRSFRMSDGAVAAPDGRWWTTDGESILRLNEHGIVDLVLGDKPDHNRLTKIAAVTVDPRNRIHAVDSRTGSIHVFDQSGSKLWICRPDPTDFESELLSVDVSADSAGRAYISNSIGFGANKTCLSFETGGRRMGWVEHGVFPQPDGDHFWHLSYNDLHLLDREFREIKTISQRPDGKWLEYPRDLAVAPDGSTAVVAHSGRRGLGRGQPSISTYDATGVPRRYYELDDTFAYPRVAYDGEKIVVAGGAGIDLIDGGKGRVKLDIGNLDSERTYWYPFLANDGSELWLYDGQSNAITIHRFAF